MNSAPLPIPEEEVAPNRREKKRLKKLRRGEALTGVPMGLRSVLRTLDDDRKVTAARASLLVAVNTLMLAGLAHALYRGPDDGALWWALVPFALTSVLSLVFAGLSALAFDGPLEPELTLRQRWHAPGEELEARELALVRSRLYLRTAYRVLLGGVVLSALTFAVCLGLITWPEGESRAPQQESGVGP